MDTTKLIGIAISFLGSLASSGPWGFAAMAIGVLSAGFGINYYIKKYNIKIDARDQDNAGADAGSTASDLLNQTRDVAKSLDELGKENPAEEIK